MTDEQPETQVRPLMRVLVVSREAPPALGPHPIRVAKLAKYLPEFGWDPTILTVPADHVWYVDHQLEEDIAGRMVVRVPRLFARVAHPTAAVSRGPGSNAPTLRPFGRGLRNLRSRLGALILQPDPSVLWAIPAARHASGLVGGFDAILTTGPPFSTHLVGAYVASRCDLPWVAEYRDNWTVNPLYRRAWAIQWLNTRLDRWFLSRARRVIVVSEAARAELSARYPSVAPRLHVAMNGFDPDDLPPRQSSPATFEMVHAGTLDERRNPRPLFSALATLVSERPDIAARIRLRLMGNVPDWAVSAARAAIGPDRVEYDGLVAHREALLRASRAAVLIGLTTRAESGDAGLTSKLLEYIGLRRPVLMLAPPGPARDVVQETGAGAVADPDDITGIATGIAELFDAWARGKERLPTTGDADRFTRRMTARQVAIALDAAVQGKLAKG